jgi:NAD(P)-dependent dehydrogenase (short-subunit alcohol dehydrogenase family)
MTSEPSLAGQVALVTGASSGLGRATAIRLAGAGADVAVFARGAQDLERTLSAVGDAGRLAVTVDLANADELLLAADRVLAEFGRVDILVNCAATEVPATSSG